MTRLIIRNERELSAALERADELIGCPEGSKEERELEHISDAVDRYQQSIDIMRDVGRKAAAEPTSIVNNIDGSE